MTTKENNKAVRTEPFRLSAQETRAIWSLAQSGEKPCHPYGASNLVELGFAKQVNSPKKDNSTAIDEAWKGLQIAARDCDLRGVTTCMAKIDRLHREEKEVSKGYVLTELGKQVARGVAVRLSSQFS
jgi:hypothetical protein